MSQAILLMLHNKINEQVYKLINYFQGKCDIFIHIDKDCKISKQEILLMRELPGVVGVYQKYHVHWAGYSMLKTEMYLLSIALKHSNFRYVHLLSGQDYPIKPLAYFMWFFENAEKEYIACRHMPNPETDNNTFVRLQNIFLSDYLVPKNDSDVSKLWNIANKLAEKGIRRRIPDHFPHIYNGSQWFSLSRKIVEELVDYTKKQKSFYRRMKYVFAPEEIYINTFVKNNVPAELIHEDNLRYIYWPYPNAQHPKVLTECDFCDIASSNAIFARKIDIKESPQLVHKIDTLLLREESLSYSNDGICEQSTIWNYPYDRGLVSAIVYICNLLNIKNVWDLGCGPGFYVHNLRKETIFSRGFDGNPNIRRISQMLNNSAFPCDCIKMHIPVTTDSNADMSLLLNVGEYISPELQDIVLDNVCKLSKKYTIICWSDAANLTLLNNHEYFRFFEENADMSYIVNPLDDCELIKEMAVRGFIPDMIITDILRKNSILPFHKMNITCFRRSDL